MAREKGDIEFFDPQGFDDSRVVRGDKRLDLHPEFLSQKLNDWLRVLQHLLGVFRRDETDAQDL